MVTGFMGESPSKAPVLDAPDFAVPAGAGGKTTSAVRPEEQVISGSMIEGSLEVKLPTIWTDEKQSRAEAGRRERLEERRVEEKE